MLEVRLLGSFDVRGDGKPIPITSRPAQSLFAYLILNAGTSHRREKLAGMLWPDSLEETARNNLRHALWRVRKALPQQSTNEYLLADDMSISFNGSADYWLDAAELEKVGESAPADELISVLSAYQGELLPGFYDEWVALEREHLLSVFEHKMGRLLSLLQDENRWLDMLEWGERWIKLGQKPEPAYRALMSAHAAKGDMSKVAATYERCVKSLREFGIEPSEQTKELYESLKSAKERRGAASPTAKGLRQEASSNIPVPLTRFIGREKEVEEIVRLLGKNRLVALIGSGGVGKTRLAIEIAGRVLAKRGVEVWWVELAAIREPTLVAQAVAQIGNVHELPGRTLLQSIGDSIGARKILLVLDNCEHLVPACAELVDRLLSPCENLRILVTSREALDILGETTRSVSSLTIPDEKHAISARSIEKFESIRLFVERATSLQGNFELTDRNAQAVGQICRRLSGIPLAIELAAARLRMMSPAEIAARLEDRFALLTGGSRGGLPRQRTLRATIDWSFDLLTDAERELFCQLSVFLGGFELPAAEVVSARRDGLDPPVVNLLGQLIAKSLVMRDEPSEEVEGASRYRMLETIREYAREKLDDSGRADEFRNRHLEYYVALAEEAETHIFGAESVRYHKRIDLELDNTRAAMDWAIETGQVSMAFRLGAALAYFWYNRSFVAGEWQGQLNRALEVAEGSSPTPERANALNARGFSYWATLVPVSPRRELEEALVIGRKLEDKRITAMSLCNLGLIESTLGDYTKARSLLEQSLVLLRELGLERNLEEIWVLTFLGDADLSEGQLAGAGQYYSESSSILRNIRDTNFLAYVVRRQGQLAWYQRRFEDAVLLCGESLELNQDLGDERGVIASLSAFAGIATAREQTISATRLLAGVGGLLETRGIRLVHLDRLEFDRNTAALRERLDQDTFARVSAEGRAMTLGQAIAFALGEAGA